MKAPTALSGTSPKYVMEILYNYSTVSFWIWGRREGARQLSEADEIEKELDGALVRAEKLRGAVLKSAFEGRLVMQGRRNDS